MELRQLEYFVVVAEERHFTRAAQRLQLAQSGLSHTIRALERELGATLFIRNSRQVTLTEAGRVLLVEARRALAAVQGTRDAVAAVQGLLRGRLSIGNSQLASISTPQGELSVILGNFHRQYPGVELHFQEGPAVALLAGVREGSLDIAFVSPVGQSTQGLSVTELTSDVLVLVCAPSHPLVHEAAVSFLDLAEAPFVDFMPQGVLRQHVDRGFAAVQRERRTTAEVETMSTALVLVAQGIGVSVVPRLLARQYPGVRTVPLRPEVTLPFAAVTADDPPVSAAARALLAMVTTTAGDLEFTAS